jgi:hypothetical protein
VVAIGQPADRPERGVLRQASRDAAQYRRPGDERLGLRVDRPEQRAVRHVQRQADRRPLAPARDELAEQLDVVVAGTEDPLVERLLRRPYGRGRATGGRTAHASLHRHRP